MKPLIIALVCVGAAAAIGGGVYIATRRQAASPPPAPITPPSYLERLPVQTTLPVAPPPVAQPAPAAPQPAKAAPGPLDFISEIVSNAGPLISTAQNLWGGVSSFFGR